MSNHMDLIASIVADPSKHLVNKAEKMERTVKVMVDNAEKIIAKNEGGSLSTSPGNRGYGEGRKMGD